MMAAVDSGTDWAVDEGPDEPMSFPELTLVANQAIASGKPRSGPKPAAVVVLVNLLADDRRKFT